MAGENVGVAQVLGTSTNANVSTVHLIEDIHSLARLLSGGINGMRQAVLD